MRWPWLRDKRKLEEESDETDQVRIRLQLVMQDLRSTLDDAERVIKSQAIEKKQAIEGRDEDGR